MKIGSIVRHEGAPHLGLGMVMTQTTHSSQRGSRTYIEYHVKWFDEAQGAYLDCQLVLV